MTTLADYANAAFATFRRDVAVYFSYRLRWVSQVAGMFLTLTIFFYVSKLVRADAIARGDYYAFVVVGIVTMGVVNAALTLSRLVQQELIAGNFERILISPLGPIGGAVSLAVFPIVYATVFAGLMLTIAALVFGIPIHAGGIPLAMIVASLAGVAFASIGLVFVGGLLAYKSSMGSIWVISALGLLGGVYFPVVLFPSWIRWASEVQPLTPTVDLLRHLLVGTPSLQPEWLELVKVTGFAAVLMPIAMVALWGAVRLSCRRGTIMEY